MGNFTNISFKNLEGWIPESDVDGVDVRENVASDISVFRFKNGFLENDLDVETETLPTLVSDKVAAGWSIKSIHKFNHSTQGNKTFYVLWKDGIDDIDRLKMYLDDEYITLGEGDSYSVLEAPNNINYNLVNDELKINLNCDATMGDKSVILNLSLQYLDAVVYNSENNVQRDAGWYICPRWLGWKYPDTYDFIENVSITESSITESFDSSPVESLENFDLYNMVYGSGYIAIKQPSKENCYFSFYNNNGLPLRVTVESDGSTITGNSGYNVKCYVGNTFVGSADHPHSSITARQTDTFVFTPDMRENNNIIKITFESYDGQSHIYVYETEFIYTEMNPSLFENGNGVMIAKYTNGERSLLGNVVTANGIIKIGIDEDLIDWRISGYEIYSIPSGGSTYVLHAYISADGDDWQYDSINHTVTKSSSLDESSNTLNLKYNLPYDARVDNQSLIYSEVSYKGRVYFVKDDFKVYQSHIAGNGIIQPDSFPYDEEQGFGYFVVSRTRKNIALAISSTNDMVVFTSDSIYVYQIQPSGASVFRRLLMISGSVGLSSRKSIAKSEEGNPSTYGLLWADNNGIYYYNGGIRPPENLLLPSHIEYWRDISNAFKSNLVGYYDATRQEYILYISNNTLLSFEIPYKRFRKSGFSAISEVVGLEGNVQYVRSENSLYKFVNNSYQTAYIESHYNSGYSEDRYGRQYKAEEIDDKILQELYVILGEGTDSTADIRVQLFWDGHTYPSLFTVDATKKYWKIPMPIIRFRRIKLRIQVYDAKKVIIRDWGVNTVWDGKEALGVHS